MNPFRDSVVWRELDSRRRRAIMRSLEITTARWSKFQLPPDVTMDKVKTFAERNLLRGFFEQRGRIITAVSARQTFDGIELGLALSPHPLNVSLPCSVVSFRTTLRLCFGAVTPIPNPTEAKKEQE